MTDAPWRPATRDGEHVVACVGETMVSFVPPDGSAQETADTLSLDIAGAESNVATYLAAHGISARWISRLGDDAFGRRILARVRAAGVDVSGTRTDPTRPTGLLFKDPVFKNPEFKDPKFKGPEADGRNGTKVTYYRRGSAASAMDPALLDEPALRTATLWHFTGITPALSEGCRRLVESALTGAHATVSFDVNYRPTLWQCPPVELLHALAQAADIVFVGLDEAQALWGADLREPIDVRTLLPSPRILVVKDGPRSATAFFGDKHTNVPALPVNVIEPVGAGDAFAAGFLAGLLQAEPIDRCLRLGHITAASALTVRSDHGPLPPRTTVDRHLGLSAHDWAGTPVTA